MRYAAFILIFFSTVCFGQSSSQKFILKYIFAGDRKEWDLFNCNTYCQQIIQHDQKTEVAASKEITFQNVPPSSIIPFLKVTGNILYELNYRSLIDTPYYQTDIYEHSAQVTLSVLIKNQYPLRVQFNTRSSNSNVFRDFSNFHFEFMRNDLIRKLKSDIEKKIPELSMPDSLKLLEDQVAEKKALLQSLKQSSKDMGYLQHLVEEREKAERARKHKITKDTINNIATDQLGLSSVMELRQRQIDSISQRITEIEKNLNKVKQENNDRGIRIRKSIIEAKSGKEMKALLSEVGVSDSLLPKGYQFLLDVRSVGIGRFFTDYSELSVQNLSVNGAHFEYNPGYYYAVAAGYVDYRYRDFVIRNHNRSYLSVVRFGKGQPESDHIIATYYSGKREMYGINSAPGEMTLLSGLTIEAKKKLDAHTFIIAEVAKSSIPYYFNGINEKPLKSLFSFEGISSEAYSIKLNTFFPKTKTRIEGSYKKTGANFQSFSLYSVGVTRSAWVIKAEQDFFKKKLSIISSVKKNQFDNPFISQQYQSSVVFKSIQATLRIKKMPILSFGYYPSSQLIKLNEQVYSENLFYTLNASLVHYLQLDHHLVNLFASYTKFYNKPSDSGFIYFNTQNLMAGGLVQFDKCNMQLNIARAANQEYCLNTVEGNLNYKIRDWFMLGGGLKYNKHSREDKLYLGYNANLQIAMRSFGEIQLYFDKGYLPGNQKNLVDNNYGRLSYYKTF